MRREWTVMISVGLLALATSRAAADYNWAGDGLQCITSGNVANGALYMQSLGLFSNPSSAGSGGLSFGFTNTPAATGIVDARLVLGIYGGSASNTCQLVTTVNGTTASTIGTLGGKTDSNPTYTAHGTNVYGSTSSGAWVVSIPVQTCLNTNGSADMVHVAATTSNGFDGRIVYASLWEVYQNPALNNTFQYAVAEGSGDIYNSTPSNAPGGTVTAASRWVDFGSFNTTGAQAATLNTLYTYVHPGQDNKLYLSMDNLHNGTLTGGDPAVSSSSTYAPVQSSFDVLSSIANGDNWAKFSVDPADGVSLSTGSYGANVLRPQAAILDATSAVPEPGTIIVLGIAGASLLLRRKRWC